MYASVLPCPPSLLPPGRRSCSVNRDHVVRTLTVKHRRYLSFGIVLRCINILYSSLSLNYTILPRVLHITSCFLDDSAHFDEPFDIIRLELSKCMVYLLL